MLIFLYNLDAIDESGHTAARYGYVWAMVVSALETRWARDATASTPRSHQILTGTQK